MTCPQAGPGRRGACRHDFDGRRPARDQAGPGREALDADAHRNALCEPDPGERWCDPGQEVSGVVPLVVGDGRRDAFHPAFDVGIFSQQAHACAVPDGDLAQFGLLEIALDAQRSRIDQGHGLRSRCQVVARVHVEVGDDATDACTDLGTLQIHARDVAIRQRALERGFQRHDLRGALLAGLGCHQLAERDVAARLLARLLQLGLGLDDGRVRAFDRGRKAGPVQHEQELAGTDGFVVTDENLRHQAADIGGHAHDVRADAAVAGPRRLLVTAPCLCGDKQCGRSRTKGKGVAAEQG
jgi:hypothetical protein